MKSIKVVIVGGGFAGINLAKNLAKDKTFRIILVDKNNYNFFPPLLYQVATGFLTASNISYPFRKLFRNKGNVQFQLGEFLRVIPDENAIETSSGNIHYDYLIFATGTETNYFGMERVKEAAVPMKTINDALNMRNYLLLQLEKAAVTKGIEEKRKLMTIVVAGGGPTGVEVAGMLAEMRKYIFVKDYPELNIEDMQIYLADALPVVLSPMSKESQGDTTEALKKMGVQLWLTNSICDYVNGEVIFANGKRIATDILIWTAGVIAKALPGLSKVSIGKGQRVLVDAFNKIKGANNIYAIGDICLQTTDTAFPQGHPQLAQVAIQQGKLLAENLKAAALKKAMHPFTYKDKGTMAIIGEFKAVVDLPKSHLKGPVAFLIWLVVHLFSLASYRNQVKTVMNWSWAFFTRDQALRFIIRPEQTE